MTKKRFLVIYDGFGEDSDVLIREDIDEWTYTLTSIYEKGEYNKAGIDEIINRLNELYEETQFLKEECKHQQGQKMRLVAELKRLDYSEDDIRDIANGGY